MREDRETEARFLSEVWARLEEVPDPELDEPITAMGFVELVSLRDGGRVEVDFRLPTYWCSPNFAFLMAEGIHREVSALSWVERVDVRLHDHMFAEQVNEGVNGGRDFHEIFRELSDGTDLAELRAKFEEKAFQRRQECVLLALRASGVPPETIVAMTLDDLGRLVFEAEDARMQLPRYRTLLVARGLARFGTDPAFRTWSGAPLTADGFADHLQRLKSVRLNMEFNGALCRGLKRARYHEHTAGDEEPTLVDFIRGRVPARHAGAAV
ncbi:MAG: DUF59 domain-containing protein [Rhodobacteraceae bacterium]|nr:DUF59 domain-containing protein [Paracoccaceae bacterium]